MITSSPNTQFEVHLTGDPGKFCVLAEQICSLLNGSWITKADGLDQSYWDLQVGDALITVHREHYLGVSVFGPATTDGIQIENRIRSHFKVIK